MTAPATATATLEDGSRIEYFTDVLGRGAMKTVHLSTDRKSVVCFFTDKPDATREARLGFVLHKYNPTLAPDTGDYFKRLFCWPTAIVKQPRLGIVCPTYPDAFFFAGGRFKGKEKKANWFVRPRVRRLVEADQLGPWINYVRLSILLARAVRRMHLAGLAHSDLSCNNVLIDPTTGQSIVIDIDSLVVANLHPADVVGTPKYIAPEVVETQDLPLGDPAKRLPGIATDLHSLPVLLYEYLLHRHPLDGPKIHSTASTEADEALAMGAKALFIEHPTDHSNRPDDLPYPYTVLGLQLAKLFREAFVDGLHDPQRRPSAADWERALVATWDLLHPCRNPACTHKWFVFDPARPACGFCGTKVAGPVPLLRLRKPGMRPGQWVADGAIVGFDTPAAKQCLYPWHVLDNFRNDERTRPDQKKPVADFAFYRGAWILMNRDLPTLTSAKGSVVPIGQAAGLAHGSTVTLSTDPHGRMAEVEIVQP